MTLRPLHWRELPGFLAAEIGPYIVEFRVPERWDEAIGEPVVLVHRFADNHSYLVPADGGQHALTAGSVLTVGRLDWPYGEYFRIAVTDIGPIQELVMHVARLAESELTGNVGLQLAIRRSVLQSIADATQALYEESDFVSIRPPKAKELRLDVRQE